MDEASKLKKHLQLLQDEYVKLHSQYAEMERKYNILVASKGDVKEDHFVCRLLQRVANLYDKDLYSDLTVQLSGSVVKAHKFILYSRSDKWGVDDLATVDELDWTHIPPEIGQLLLKWIYTDIIHFPDGENTILGVIKIAKSFELTSLIEKCEEALMQFVTVKNCVRFYQIADENEAKILRNHCSQLISTYWNDFSGDDFAHMPAPLLYKMFKEKSSYPLHTAIRTQREDVVFLYLIEYASQLYQRVNEFDNEGRLPLDLALESGQFSIARTLISRHASIDIVDKESKTLLHRAVERCDTPSAVFLIDNGACVDSATEKTKKTPLHILCDLQQPDELIASRLIQQCQDLNVQDLNGNTCLHITVLARNTNIFKLLLGSPKLALDVRNANGLTPLALGLLCLEENPLFANELVSRGSSVDMYNPLTGDSLLHIAACDKNEAAGIFLIENHAKVDNTNKRGESALHISASLGLNELVKCLLKNGANCNLVTSPPPDEVTLLKPKPPEKKPPSIKKSDNPFDDEEVGLPEPPKPTMPQPIDDSKIYNQTALHLAVLNRHENVIRTIVEYKNSNVRDLMASIVAPNLNIKNSAGETPLATAIRIKNLLDIAQLLIDEGANVNIKDGEGFTLLHRAILSGDSRGALFLLNNNADVNTRTPSGESPIQLAVKQQLESVLINLCSKGESDVNVLDEHGNPPIWLALENENEDMASILVQYDCDTNAWSEGPGGCQQTLLHRAIDQNNEFIACFLIRSGCDVNCPRRPSPDGRGGEEAYDGQVPLHMACCWGLETVVQTLLEFTADVNIQDAEGKTALHIAIENQRPTIVSLLLSHPALNLNTRDKTGSTPFATAMTIKNNKAAQEILNRDPNAAEKNDAKGYNFLHTAIKNRDIESVMFLLSINVNIHSKVQDQLQLTPLHLAVENDLEIVVRSLLLAGAQVNELSSTGQTALHVAAEHDHAAICSILLENCVNFNAVDCSGNNALHIACQRGHLATCKVLLLESDIGAVAVNGKGQTPLHCLAQMARENAATIFELFMQTIDDYPIDKPDEEGNTPLLLAYINGNVNLCRALIKSNACLGTINKNGTNIFNCQVASNNLLYKLLDNVSQEPKWSSSDSCLECCAKFGITNRRHHCRHCGRVLCSKCSSREITIPKFSINKPSRVCEICFDVLMLGFSC